MTNAEIGEKALNEMYTFIMSGISAASSALEGKPGTGFTVWMGGVDGVKDIVTHPNENHYEAVGRTVGNMIGIVASLCTGNLVKKATIKTKAVTAFGVSKTLAEMSLGDAFANLLNTYVANADAFYSKILSDADYADEVWNGIVDNGLNNFVDYFDPDGDGNVSPSDIVNGYKKLFSPPPAYGTVEFEALYNPSNKSTIIINTQIVGAQKAAVEEVVQHNIIKSATVNNHSFDIAISPSNLHLRNALTSIDDYQFLLSNVTIKPGEKLDMGSAGIVTVGSVGASCEIPQANRLYGLDCEFGEVA
jgi:hypothetical protein